MDKGTKHDVLSGKIVLVTGAAGFIGSATAAVLLERGDVVVGVDEMNTYYDKRIKQSNVNDLKSNYDHFTMYVGDICDNELMMTIFAQHSITHVCHLAARAGVRPSIQDPFIYVHSNIEGTTRLLDLARQYNIANFVYASSSSVYGSSTAEVLREEDVVEKPVSPYAATKKACELIAYTYHHLYGLNTTGLRFFTVYGPRGRPDMAPFKFIDRIFNDAEIQQYGDGYTSRDYTYISDIVDGVVRSIDRPLGYQVFNLGNGRPFLLKNFIQLVVENVGKEAIIKVLPEQPGDVKHTCACIKKARDLLGYNPQVTFEEGISKTVAWYKDAHASGVFDTDDDISDEDGTTTASVESSAGGIALVSAIKSHDRLSRCVSDLELSSFVQKASEPIERRQSRFVDDNKSSDFNNAYMKLYAKNDPTAPVSPGGSTGVFRVEEKSLPDSPNRNRTNSTEAVGLEF